jgi:hypothetical protein
MAWNWLSRVGTLTRHPADRYPERCAWAYGLYKGPSATANGFLELYNNDQQGRRLRIYSIITGGIANSGHYLAVTKGPVGSDPPAEVGSTLVGGIVPLVSSYPAPPGLLLAGNSAAGSSSVQPAFPILTFAGFSLASVLSPAPLAIIQQGDSALAWEWQGEDFAEAALFYMWD